MTALLELKQKIKEIYIIAEDGKMEQINARISTKNTLFRREIYPIFA